MYAYCTGPMYTMETAACNDTTKFQLVGFTICKLPWVQLVNLVSFIYLNFVLLRVSVMSVRGVRSSRHHAASEASQELIDLQLRSNSLCSLYICLHKLTHCMTLPLHCCLYSLRPAFGISYQYENFCVVICNITRLYLMPQWYLKYGSIQKLKLQKLVYSINKMTRRLY